jgi:diguanylate cyclase (GGDEF)-like protein/PAS domain S-box-containing protein
MSEAPPPDRLGRTRRWLQRAYAALVISALVGVLVIVANSTRLVEQLTAEVAVAQRRSEHLSNSQREVLRLLQAVTEAAAVSPPTAQQLRTVQVRRGLFGRQIVVAGGVFPPDSPEGREILAIAAGVDGLNWAALERGDSAGAAEVLAELVVAERRMKALYDAQTRNYYHTTTRSLHAKERGQQSLAGLAGLVAILGFGWIFTIRRASRNDLRRAYEKLVTEMHERRAAEDAVRTSEQRFRSLVQRASDLTCVTDALGVLTYVSPAVETLLGYDAEEFVGAPLADRVHDDDRPALASAVANLGREPSGTATVDFRIQASDGRWRNIEAVGRNLLEDSAINGIVWNGRDVTDRRLLQDELTYQAYHDSLTGLPNRALLTDRLDLARAVSGRDVAVLLIDLDGFKAVNDTMGHPAGDELLRQVAERLTRCLRTDDLAARLGGDEFAAVVDTGPDVDLLAIAARILTALREPYDLKGRTVIVGASIGVATGEADASDLLRDADIAMYTAKAAGKNRVEVFKPHMLDQTTEQSTLEQALIGAIGRGEFEVYYQPIVDLTTGRIVALESLARWRHPERGYVSPGVFIPIAERTGLIVELGRHILVEACAAAVRFRRLPEHRDLGITVNVSGRQAISGDLVTQAARALAVSGLEASALTLEITESVLLEDTETVHAHFTGLRDLGVHVAVDDFGAGYSSIGSLLRFSADILKIDRSFLEFDSARQGSLVQAVSDLGRTLDLLVVAEGVETAEQVGLARDAGCHAAQGYWFARPADEGQTMLLLQSTPILIDAGQLADV